MSDFDCPTCGGTGLVQDDEQWKYPCPVCKGQGMYNKQEMKQLREEDWDQLEKDDL